MRASDEFDIIIAYRRAANILRIEEKKDGVSWDQAPDAALVAARGEPAEQALLAALETHEWAVWVDSDAVALAPERDLAPLIDTDAEIVAQDPDAFFADLGLEVVAADIGARVEQALWVDWLGLEWDGDVATLTVDRPDRMNSLNVDTLDAIEEALKRRPPEPGRIRYVGDLQAPPRLADRATRFVHFYGDRAAPLLPEAEAARVLDAFADAVRAGRGFREEGRPWGLWRGRRGRTEGAAPRFSF